LMSTGDLAGYQAVVREPVVSEYRDVTVYGMGLPSSGGLTIALALNQLERFDLGDAPREEALHRYLESIGLAWADRNAFMGDPEYVDAPVEGLLSQDYADDRSALIGETATPTPRLPGDPFAYQDDPSPSGPLPAASAARSGSTTHLTVSDGEGNVVSYTFTIEQTGGSGIVVPGHGFLLNNELTDFDPVPPHPNAPEAGKRPRSSMSPTLVFRDGEPVLALGTPGGATIITTVLQTMLGVLDFGQTLPEAIAAPRLADFNGESSIAEPTFLATPEAAALRDRGHTFTESPEIGAATGIQFMADGTILVGAEPSRRGGGSAGALGPSQPSPPPG
nr:gamma-glutamyltransferase [Euzebyaceae bacterium]